MISAQEVLRKVSKVAIKSKWTANHLFAGNYKTAFKGTGMRFKEVREYEPGDDVRFIDWNVSARQGHPYIKIFEEERDLPVYLLVDISTSTEFGSTQSKKELMIQMAADLAFSAASGDQKVGLMLFSDKIEYFIKPQKNTEHLIYLISQLITFKSINGKTNISNVLNSVNNIIHHRSVFIIISDFADMDYEQSLGVISRRHDVIGIHLYDKYDKELPYIGWLNVRDPETTFNITLNTSSTKFRRLYKQQFIALSEYAEKTFRKTGGALIHVETGVDHIPFLQNFFLSRIK